MPHLRKRYAAPRIIQIAKYSSIVGVLGQRQVGKTTLLEAASSEYVTFDKSATLTLAQKDAAVFLQGHRQMFGIDEAQLCDPLFPALKEHVRVNKKPGQFILSGSVRFTSKKSLRESLTGRIVSTEVLPFTLHESHDFPMPETLFNLAKVRRESDLKFLKDRKWTAAAFTAYLTSGGLPGICFFRDTHIRADKFESHLDTLLNRDIRQVYPTTLAYQSLRNLLTYLAENQGRIFELGEASRTSQISVVTLKKVLFAFEALFLIRRIHILGSQKPTYFLEDQGMATWLKGRALQNSYDIARGLYANMRQELHYRPKHNGKIFQWRTKNNVEVPLVFEFEKQAIGFIPQIDSAVVPKTLGSAQSFLKHFPQSKVIIAYNNPKIIFKNPRMFWIPYWLLC